MAALEDKEPLEVSRPPCLKLATPFAFHAKGSAEKIAKLLSERMHVVTNFYKRTPEKHMVLDGCMLLMVKLLKAVHPRHSYSVSLAWDPVGGDLRTDFKVFEFACPDNFPQMSAFERFTEQQDAEAAKDDEAAADALTRLDNEIRQVFPSAFVD